jgi:type II secretory pathway pseudopilin PulG
MINLFRKSPARKSAGDTIIEVLIVLAVLGLGLSIAYATANRGLQTSQAAEEHSQALSLMASQIEQVRTAVAASNAGVLQTTSAFCFDSSHNLVTLSGFKPASQENLNELTAANYGACVVNGLYYQSITYDGSGLFTVKMRWPGLGTLGAQQESLNYRLYTVSPTNNNITIANGQPTGGNSDAGGGIAPAAPPPNVTTCPSTSTPNCPSGLIGNYYHGTARDPDPLNGTADFKMQVIDKNIGLNIGNGESSYPDFTSTLTRRVGLNAATTDYAYVEWNGQVYMADCALDYQCWIHGAGWSYLGWTLYLVDASPRNQTLVFLNGNKIIDTRTNTSAQLNFGFNGWQTLRIVTRVNHQAGQTEPVRLMYSYYNGFYPFGSFVYTGASGPAEFPDSWLRH